MEQNSKNIEHSGPLLKAFSLDMHITPCLHSDFPPSRDIYLL